MNLYHFFFSFHFHVDLHLAAAGAHLEGDCWREDGMGWWRVEGVQMMFEELLLGGWGWGN